MGVCVQQLKWGLSGQATAARIFMSECVIASEYQAGQSVRMVSDLGHGYGSSHKSGPDIG